MVVGVRLLVVRGWTLKLGGRSLVEGMAGVWLLDSGGLWLVVTCWLVFGVWLSIASGRLFKGG